MSAESVASTLISPPKPAKRNRAVGYVVSCDGREAKIISIAGAYQESQDYWAVGQLVSIQVGENRVVGLLHKVETRSESWNPKDKNALTLHVELSGEVHRDEKRGNVFSGGISSYPHVGAVAHRIRHADLTTIYKAADQSAVSIGSLSQSPDVPALVSTNTLLSRHFAVFGTTGTGKSTAVSLILHLIAEKKRNQRILILDPHNEYTSAFGTRAITLSAEALDLPFWLLTLEELTHVIYRGNEPVEDEVHVLRDLITRAKQIYSEKRKRELRRSASSNSAITSDLPVPYRLADLMHLLNTDIGSLDRAQHRLTLSQLKMRLESVVHDPRFAFLFGSNDATDRMDQILGQIFRIPLDNKPITVFQMSGIPSEVVDSIASVLCRLAFEIALASKSQAKTLVVCEEAHRYIPANKSGAFGPTRTAISRIAKEGRKYGVSLAIISQRPNELDPTILSQCNTFFSLRLGNEADQNIMRQAMAVGSRSTLSFLSSLADRECIAFGSALPLPMRLRFRSLPASARPHNLNISQGVKSISNLSVESIVDTLRGQVSRSTSEEPENRRLPKRISLEEMKRMDEQSEPPVREQLREMPELRENLRTKTIEPDDDLDFFDTDT